MKGWLAGCGSAALASLVLDGGEGIDRGWKDLRACRQYLNSKPQCRELAEEAFKYAFPALSYEWSTCGQDDKAEALLRAAVSDPRFVDRYMQEFRRLCSRRTVP